MKSFSYAVFYSLTVAVSVWAVAIQPVRDRGHDSILNGYNGQSIPNSERVKARAEAASSSWTVGQMVKTSSGTVQGHAAESASEVSEYLGIPYAKSATGDLRFAAPEAFTGDEVIPGDKFSSDCPTVSVGFGGGSLPGTGGPDLGNGTGAGNDTEGGLKGILSILGSLSGGNSSLGSMLGGTSRTTNGDGGDSKEVRELLNSLPENNEPFSGGTSSPLHTPRDTASLEGTLIGLLPQSAQNLAILAQYGSSIGSGSNPGEDCLSINIWTKPQTGEKSKAVMMWIYGGGFQMGTSSGPAYNGAKLADQEDVVVVTFNYRTNFFGFEAPPNNTAYNYGLLDQRMATQWVKQNIAGFGGDPNRITLFGQSAGGASVDIYAYAWTKDPVVNAFIPESGAVGTITSGDPDAQDKWFTVSKALGCGTSADSLACVRKKPLSDVMREASGTFLPVRDDITIFGDFAARGNSGKFIKRPVLVGNNNNEARLFSAVSFGLLNISSAVNPMFQCPAGNAARYRAINNVPVYRYEYFGDWPNLNISSDTGAFHSAEVPMIFGNAESLTGVPDTEDEIATAVMMRKIWTAFAKDPDKGLDALKLPRYDPNGNTLIELGYNNSPVPVMAPSTSNDNACVSN